MFGLGEVPRKCSFLDLNFATTCQQNAHIGYGGSVRNSALASIVKVLSQLYLPTPEGMVVDIGSVDK